MTNNSKAYSLLQKYLYKIVFIYLLITASSLAFADGVTYGRMADSGFSSSAWDIELQQGVGTFFGNKKGDFFDLDYTSLPPVMLSGRLLVGKLDGIPVSVVASSQLSATVYDANDPIDSEDSYKHTLLILKMQPKMGLDYHVWNNFSLYAEAGPAYYVNLYNYISTDDTFTSVSSENYLSYFDYGGGIAYKARYFGVGYKLAYFYDDIKYKLTTSGNDEYYRTTLDGFNNFIYLSFYF